jgi:NTE family protein
MGLPAVFTPVEKDGTVLIDGGGVNPVPWSALDGCSVTVAVDVLGEPAESGGEEPGAFKALMDMFDIMQRSIVSARMKAGGPDIYVRPDIIGVGILDFHRAEEIYSSAGPSRDELRKKLSESGF